jgi:preprotein translocase subunit YajC
MMPFSEPMSALPAGLPALLAQGANAQQGSPFAMLVPMILVFVIFYFMGIRPQQQKAKQLAELVKQLKKGDKVSAAGGIIGHVVSVGDTTVTIRSAESKLEVQKGAVTEVLEKAPAGAAQS